MDKIIWFLCYVIWFKLPTLNCLSNLVILHKIETMWFWFWYVIFLSFHSFPCVHPSKKKKQNRKKNKTNEWLWIWFRNFQAAYLFSYIYQLIDRKINWIPSWMELEIGSIINNIWRKKKEKRVGIKLNKG